MKPFQILSAFVYALLFSLTANAFQAPARQDGSADAPQATRRIVNDLDRVVLPGNVHPLATPEHRIWRTDGKLPMERIILVLKRRPGADTKMDALIAQLYHHRHPQRHTRHARMASGPPSDPCQRRYPLHLLADNG